MTDIHRAALYDDVTPDKTKREVRERKDNGGGKNEEEKKYCR